MKRFLHVSVVWGVSPKLTDQLKPILDLADDWVTYGASNWILYTTEDIFVWQGRFCAVMDTTIDHCFICEIANIQTTTAGWLPKWIWEWLRKNREAPLSLFSPGMILPPVPKFKP